ncbi:DUF3300 domain-containing protein [Massilia sp. PAMC28688]|uniref:DUF3300 domain-containing protein n=1 Tax=Massilia sp. PAMC28688 TaxID=2861283 RepID=UPI001C638DA8|nr:DUF3300 domain-containing protein [Massilia sp. PAMC28688]QYF93296.1 DUF3300 domain-containing protein [Massilia sp. PAMC28688]
MKLLTLAFCLALAGCAATPPGSHTSHAPRDPRQWRVVSVTPVPAGTAARVAATSPDGKAVEYSYNPAPFHPPPAVYTPRPVYSPGPYYPEPAYYWPPVHLSLGFVFGHHWSRGRMRGGWRR